MQRNVRYAVSLAAFALFIAALYLIPVEPYAVRAGQTLSSPSREFLLGTDELGRSIASRVFAGFRNSLALTAAGALLSVAAGALLALAAVSAGAATRALISFFSDALLIVPVLMICLVVAASAGGGVHVLIVGQAAAFIPLAQRASAQELRRVLSMEFSSVALRLGMSRFRVALKHGMPFLLPKMGSLFISLAAVAVGIEGSLSYFGLGIPVPRPGLGSLLQHSRGFISTNPLYFLTTMMIFALVLCALSALNYMVFQRRLYAPGFPFVPQARYASRASLPLQ